MYYFFFQAEDGIRDLTVTGVQTCALPIYSVVRVRRIRPIHGDVVVPASWSQAGIGCVGDVIDATVCEDPAVIGLALISERQGSAVCRAGVRSPVNDGPQRLVPPPKV